MQEWREDRQSWVYAVLSIDSWSWHGVIQRDYLPLHSVMMVEFWKIKRDGGRIWEQYGGYEQRREIRGMTCQIGFKRPHTGVLTWQIVSHTCCIRNGKLNHTWYFLKSQFLMLLSPHLLSSFSFSFSTLPSPKNTKLCHPPLSIHAIIMS